MVLEWFLVLMVGQQPPGKYVGNQWERPLRDDEWYILFYFFREVAFLWDFIADCIDRMWRKEKFKCTWRSTALPQTQGFRYLVSIYTLLRSILFYYVFKYLLFHAVELIFNV